ncbi:hypothetical protein Ahy_B01g053774 isoform G [Arachis hypogaea]|uniref:Uncharacterized protein n=2 Tax=Arachis hypogaea TaxID=3818 RepID=A0A445ASJ9_ARAHY|nr:hypothetical protein Ahy_B01g053774 isoform G [Arachis hypogaea]
MWLQMPAQIGHMRQCAERFVEHNFGSAAGDPLLLPPQRSRRSRSRNLPLHGA